MASGQCTRKGQTPLLDVSHSSLVRMSLPLCASNMPRLLEMLQLRQGLHPSTQRQTLHHNCTRRLEVLLATSLNLSHVRECDQLDKVVDSWSRENIYGSLPDMNTLVGHCNAIGLKSPQLATRTPAFRRHTEKRRLDKIANLALKGIPSTLRHSGSR
jgi:hypothetical protein